ncbi:uncharacterized protein LOC126227762 isoform X1 [Schistocerca nitens]|uniref:uncharacterized protein LOC126227762 isoform X1 n=1 Tax=Schistocerca nitens TaxID=7011 RepID=UPI0021172DC1|nr:uncharacterized protein LOC126227762 isoform X1 [Schistocerca nitens]
MWMLLDKAQCVWPGRYRRYQIPKCNDPFGLGIHHLWKQVVFFIKRGWSPIGFRCQCGQVFARSSIKSARMAARELEMRRSTLHNVVHKSTQETFTVGCAVENSSPSTPQCSPELFKVGHYATSKKQAKDVLVSSTLSMLRDKQTAMNGSNEDGKLGQCVGAELITTKNRKLKAETKCLITNAIMGAIQKVTDC